MKRIVLWFFLLLLAWQVLPASAQIVTTGKSCITVTEIDGSPVGCFTIVKFSNGAVTNNGDGTATIVTGAGGGGDASTNTSSTTNGQLAIASGTGGKTIAFSSLTGVIKATGGVAAVAVAGTDYVVPAGNVATATALAANGANCSAGAFPLGVDASGAVESCSTSISGNAATATALAANGTNCSAGQAARGVDAAGNAEDCFTPPGGGGSGDALTSEGLDQFAATTSAELAAVLTDEVGTTGGFLRAGGNAATATALAANGSNCSTGSSPLGVDAGGAAEGCFDVATQTELDTHTNATTAHSAVSTNTANRMVVRDGSGNFAAGTVTAALSGNASTATALAANGTNCGAGEAAAGVDASGNAEGCITVTSGSGGPIVLDLGDNGVNESAALGEIAVTGDTNAIFSEPANDKLLINVGNKWPASNTADLATAATALAANGANCSSGNSPLGVDASGAVEGCFDVATQAELDTHANLTNPHSATATNTASRIVLRDGSGNFAAGTITAALAGNSSTATALAANGANCSAGNSPLGVDASGAVEGCFDIATQSELDTGLGTKQGTVTWGAGLAATGDTARTDSTEAGFLTDGGASNLTCGSSAQGKWQVMDSGEFQYCDGATTSVLQAGRPTQTGLSWNVTAATCTGDSNGGKLTVNGSNQIVCAVDANTGGGGSAVTLDLADNGANESSGITEIATTGDTNSIFTEPAADKLLINVANKWPAANTADTATALGANPANCSAGSSPLGIDATGAAEDCFDVATQSELDTHANLTNPHSATAANTVNRLVLRDGSGNFAAGAITASLLGNASTASALAANGTNCTGQFPLGVDALGAVEGCTSTLPNAFLSPWNAQTGTSYTVVLGDNQKLVTFNNASAVAVTLPQANTTGFTSGAVFHFWNLGAGVVTITPTTSTVNGAATLVLRQGEGAHVYSDSTNYAAQVFFDSPMTTAGDLLYGGTNGIPTRLATGTGFLRGGTTPAYSALSASNPQTSTYTATTTDFANYTTIPVASGTFTLTLVATGSQPPAGQYIRVINYGSGTVTIARNGQNLNGGTASLILPASSATGPSSAVIVSDGTNYFATLDIDSDPHRLSVSNTTPITINSDSYRNVDVTDLNATTTFGIPTGTPKAGQTLTISIYTTTARGLIFDTGTSGFSAENGLTLPTTSFAGTYLTLQFRWNITSSKWGLVWSSREDYKAVQLTDAASITPNSDTTKLGYLLTLGQTTQFENPSGTPRDGQTLRLRILSTTARSLTWGSKYAAGGIPLPTTTTGGGIYDLFGFQYNAAVDKWDMIATSQSSISARRRTCMIVIGADNGPVLADADLGPQLHLCDIPSAATIEEIAVRADAGTPSVIVHRRTSTTNTALLSSALATAASGALACARPTAVAGFGGATCAATLQNTTVGAGDFTLGLTSGTAGGVAKRISIAVHYLLAS